MKLTYALLPAAAFSLFATVALAQQQTTTTTKPHKDAGNGIVSEETGSQSPLANPKVKGDKSTIKGDTRATTEQRSGAESQ